LRVVMGVQIDEAGRYDESRRVDGLVGVGGAEPSDSRDTSILDPDVATKSRHPRSIDDHPILNDKVELRHCRDLRIANV